MQRPPNLIEKLLHLENFLLLPNFLRLRLFLDLTGIAIAVVAAVTARGAFAREVVLRAEYKQLLLMAELLVQEKLPEGDL